MENVVGEIKSAWELAMEKVDKLGKFSPEELRQQKEDRCGSIGRGFRSRNNQNLHAKWADDYLKLERESSETIRCTPETVKT